MLDILSIIPGKKKSSPSGWYSFNAVCCHHRGHKPDNRRRAGIIFDGDSWNYSCFNCNFKCGTRPGKLFSKNTQSLFEWCGIDRLTIDKWSFTNYSNRSWQDHLTHKVPGRINFEDRELPEGAVVVDRTNGNHRTYVEYLDSRALSLQEYTYYCTPDAELERDRNRIIIPYYFKNRIVGSTSRFLDGRRPKYVSDSPAGFVFNYDAQHEESTSALLVEGQFDALSIGACAYLSNTISDDQASLISKLRREIIVVPDRDAAGMRITDRALELGYKVSIPPWRDDIKDANDAVKYYGRLPTLLSILDHATSSKIAIEMAKRKFTK